MEKHIHNLNSFDLNERITALKSLFESNKDLSSDKNIAFNLHCHTFYSYNGYGMSPQAIAWKAYKNNLYSIGIVDFDVLMRDKFIQNCSNAAK